jgi:hypothetical protein
VKESVKGCSIFRGSKALLDERAITASNDKNSAILPSSALDHVVDLVLRDSVPDLHGLFKQLVLVFDSREVELSFE